MGNSQSNTRTEQLSPHFTRLQQLFQQLSEEIDGTKAVKQDNFQQYFNTQGSTELGQLIFKYVCKNSGNICCESGLDQQMFIEEIEQMIDNGSSSNGQQALYFRIFSSSNETMPYEELSNMCKICYKIWEYLEDIDGSTEMKPVGINPIDALVQSLLNDMDSSVNISKCKEWMIHHISCFFNPVHAWFTTLAIHGEQKLQRCRPVHSIISWPECSQNMLVNKPLFWLLSMMLPDYFVSFKYDNLWCNQPPTEECPTDKRWSILYDSNQDGQSYNRFKHHCFSYNGPTILLIMVEAGPIIVAAVDSNWKESASYWGKNNCMLLHIQNDIQILKEGENMVFLNERTRGLPTGILFGNSSKKVIVTIDIDLASAILHYKHDTTQHNITRIEVWGCAGLTAKEKQKEQQRWERRQAEKLQKVKLPGKWDENPDRAILDMAGVTKDYGHRQ